MYRRYTELDLLRHDGFDQGGPISQFVQRSFHQYLSTWLPHTGEPGIGFDWRDGLLVNPRPVRFMDRENDVVYEIGNDFSWPQWKELPVPLKAHIREFLNQHLPSKLREVVHAAASIQLEEAA